MKTYLKIMGYSKKYSLSIVIALIASVLFTLFNALAIWMVSSLIGTIMKGDSDVINQSNTNSIIGNKIELYINNMYENIIGFSRFPKAYGLET